MLVRTQAPVLLKVDQTAVFYLHGLCSSCYLKEHWKLEIAFPTNSSKKGTGKEQNEWGIKKIGYYLKQRISDIFQFCLIKLKPAEWRR